MPNGFPAFPQSVFPNDKPPTLFHPASPKAKPAKPAKTVKDIDAVSMASTSTFSSTVSLLKGNVKSKLSGAKKTSSDTSGSQPSTMSYADYVNGEHKTRTLSPSEEEKKEVLKDFILLKK